MSVHVFLCSAAACRRECLPLQRAQPYPSIYPCRGNFCEQVNRRTPTPSVGVLVGWKLGEGERGEEVGVGAEAGGRPDFWEGLRGIMLISLNWERVRRY